ncbi:dTMP kinase [Aeromicrobium sp. PE09-221]|uniref:dTMP kinase n=1 Tax=Aeromicrobium sp. PE09-221 TaxID=1898043 RepID=UPI000B3E8788|nr:dTMP kinase [Aeromicrobium sp. PE09-221]OUZ09241.1 dTMP kinase [Aeromicrobium sp. PE09-221]
MDSSSVPALYTETGVFVAFEGGEGSGKSTQARLLAEWLTQHERGVEVTREPGGTAVGQQLRRILLDPDTGELSPRTEALVYIADKAEHVDHVVLPALAEGKVVVTDRYVDSTLAYQGAGRALRAAELEPIARWATSGLRPHLTIVLDIDPVVGLARAGSPDRIESEPLEFHQRVRQHFLELASTDPTHYVVIPADQDPGAVHIVVQRAIAPWLSQVTA